MKKYLGEGLLIVFSVLFALFINKAFEDYKTKQKKNIAIESIKKEILRNQAIIINWKDRHQLMRNRISTMIEKKDDPVRLEMQEYEYFNLSVLTNNESFIDSLITNTAWESAKTTGIIAEFDYKTIQSLTQVYDLQSIILDRSVLSILDYYYEAESHDIANLDQTLIQFQLRFWDLTGQEESMEYLYQKALNEIGD